MNMEEFKQKYEELKDNPMYQKYCSVLETKDKIIKKVKQENEHLKEQVAYLRRSVERKENRIIELEDERIPYTNEYVKKLEKQNQELKKQLEYLHGEEYLNQLRFERNMLQDVVDKMEVSKEDKRFIDMTRRNTELLEENQELKEQLSNSHQINAQQNEFIEYLNKYIKERRRLSKLHKEYSLSEERLSAQCHVLENVLLRYQETVGYKE